MAYNKEDLLKLGVEEKLALVGELWDSIDESTLPVSEDIAQVAEERYHAYMKDPGNTISLEALKDKLNKDGF